MERLYSWDREVKRWAMVRRKRLLRIVSMLNNDCINTVPLSKSCSTTHGQKIKEFLDSLPFFRLKLEIVKPLSLESVRLCFGNLVHEFVDVLCLH
jgi:hypothetical protein